MKIKFMEVVFMVVVFIMGIYIRIDWSFCFNMVVINFVFLI